ncbi:hypothetical protein C1752_15927 [Acaryochloris thomasi RCC1774]|uniref:DUF2513 domain-containing protein n=1 Tax=Acaryochloris thomasi RCC1774 TaxID=1764569 RepID=A0A2W1JER7_9CYAN|nr:DUF2513 domain-containing protein [Acaryochloris thomasi]PZD70235.1 hypothetical protein C1752_15927 [Acaryochloris thomasi RCC1774]
MEFDNNLVRKILLEAEKADAGELITSFDCDGAAQQLVSEHVYLMVKEGLLEGTPHETQATFIDAYFISRITWKGHQLLKNMKNDTIWKKVTADARDRGQSLSISILDKLLSKALEKHLGL